MIKFSDGDATCIAFNRYNPLRGESKRIRSSATIGKSPVINDLFDRVCAHQLILNQASYGG